ncbi:MAG: hypothetical protein GY768_13175 [Planctomycetaceae bacterium]|nr:hypothetical protein [Planctomycetaceae bacterium]
MIRQYVGIFVGLLAGVLVISAGVAVSSQMFPPPADLELSNREAMLEYINSLPLTALLITLFAHAFGALVAAFVCETITRSNWVAGWLLIGVLCLGGGIANLLMVPKPAWFAVVNLMLYVPAACVGGKIAAHLFSSKSAAGASV